MANSGAIQPAEATGLTCPRCRFLAPMVPVASLTFRCSRCEWPFTLAAPSVAAPAVPASGVTAANSAGTPVTVTVTDTAHVVTAVTVNGTPAASVSTPAFPATGVDVTNSGTAAQVTITDTGTVITAVNIDDVQAGTTAGTYAVSAGHKISVAYGAGTAPTWAWAVQAGAYTVPAGGTIALTRGGGTAPTWAWALPATSASVSAGGTALPFTAAGTAFAQGQVLIVDPAGTSDLVTVSGTPTATSVPVSALNASHNSGVTVTVARLSPALSGVEAVPQTAF